VLVTVTSDKGLAGAFNANSIKKAEERLAKNYQGSTSIIAVGKKAKDHFERRDFPIIKSFWKFGDYTTLDETAPVAETLLTGFLNNSWDEVWAVYTNFRTTLLQ
jgi:F-type H+-transporting ATPase subunit gamma